ncbi:MAG: Transcriptional regulator [Lactococcus sp.]|jgi:hypothetical protein|uniref:hypothetical protein n=1 Tax=Pseudolactococcus raffinolactis TaxID=1366 RepID=UPI003992B369
MKLTIIPKSKGGGYNLSYVNSELKHKDYLLDKMISDREKRLSKIAIEKVKLKEKLTLLERGISEEILKTKKQIRDLDEVIPDKLRSEIDNLIYFKGALDKKINENS